MYVCISNHVIGRLDAKKSNYKKSKNNDLSLPEIRTVALGFKRSPRTGKPLVQIPTVWVASTALFWEFVFSFFFFLCGLESYKVFS
jgi:hypothetical protein